MHTFSGIVKKGKQRGKDLGFPTANIPLEIHIPEGIYISKATFENNQHPSLTFIGRAKTFDETTYHAETYILDFNQNLYGKTLEIVLLKKIRDNQKFSSAEELIKAMENDLKEAKEYFKNSK